MEILKNNRGFEYSNFTDLYGNTCSIQKSSLATDDAIWLGVDKPSLIITDEDSVGKYVKTQMPKNWSANSRMHLNREQIAELLPILQKFVETGEID